MYVPTWIANLLPRRSWTKSSFRWLRNRKPLKTVRKFPPWGTSRLAAVSKPFSCDSGRLCSLDRRIGTSSSSSCVSFGSPCYDAFASSSPFSYACTCRTFSYVSSACAASSCTCSPSSVVSCSCGICPAGSPPAPRFLDILCHRSSAGCNGQHSSSGCRTPRLVSKQRASVKTLTRISSEGISSVTNKRNTKRENNL